VADDKVRIDNPTQNLESYFLDVVAKAKQAAAETSGAQSGGRVAAYLRGDAEKAPAQDKILQRLTLPTAASTSAPAPTPEPAAQVNQSKLASLARSNEPVPPAAPLPSTPAPLEPVDLAKANEKLSSLLNKPK
jgi:hypothetical protein